MRPPASTPAGPPALEYAERGYLRLGAIAGAREVAELLAEEARFRPRLGYGTRANRTLRVATQLCHRSEPVRRFCTTGAHLARVVELLAPDVCLTHQQFVTKLPDSADSTSEIPWHQDNGYGRLDPTTDLTVLLALTDMDEANGCLFVVPGSHRLGLLDHAAAGANPVLREVPRGETALPVPLAAGEAVAFSGLTVHGSGPNRGQAPRVALYMRYCEPQVRMLSEGGRPVLDDPHSWMVAGEAP